MIIALSYHHELWQGLAMVELEDETVATEPSSANPTIGGTVRISTHLARARLDQKARTAIPVVVAAKDGKGEDKIVASRLAVAVAQRNVCQRIPVRWLGKRFTNFWIGSEQYMLKFTKPCVKLYLVYTEYHVSPDKTHCYNLMDHLQTSHQIKCSL